MEDERLVYSVKEAAKVLGIHHMTVYELVRLGKIPTVKTLGITRILISKKALEKLIESDLVEA